MPKHLDPTALHVLAIQSGIATWIYQGNWCFSYYRDSLVQGWFRPGDKIYAANGCWLFFGESSRRDSSLAPFVQTPCDQEQLVETA